MNFKAGEVVVAKDEYIEPHETKESTAGIVLEYNPQNDYLALGVLHPENYAIPPSFSMRGCFYRRATPQELKEWGIQVQKETTIEK